ncbi:MAG: aminoacyltransferase [Candidatus Nomurabacteria bacterium]|jgi:alanine adding enzyme|nr:aminoacyltransferase [Candidatus Nomurabacteria bacterium]
MNSKWTFCELPESEWDKFEASHEGTHFFQSVQRINMRKSMGYQNYIVGLREDKKIVAGGVLLGRRGEFWMAYGPLIDWDNQALVETFLNGLINFSREKKMIKLEVFPGVLLSLRDSKGQVLEQWNRDELLKTFADAGFHYEGKTVNYEMKAGRWAFTKDLSGIKNIDELRATYRKTLRARLRQTDGQVEIQKLNRDELGKLIGLIDESDAHHGVNGRELDYYQKMFDAFGQDVEFLIALKSDNKTPVAGAIFIRHGQEVASYLSGMDRRYRNLNGRAWLQDYVMQKYLGKKVQRVNFFWIEGKFRDNRLLEFKSGFGGVVEEYIGGFEKVLQPAKYQTKRVARKAKSLTKKLINTPRRLLKS